LDDQGPIGVCCDVSVDIGGVEVKQHIFVVQHSNHDLILGQLWERVGNVLRGQYSSMKRLALLLFGSKVGTMRQWHNSVLSGRIVRGMESLPNLVKVGCLAAII